MLYINGEPVASFVKGHVLFSVNNTWDIGASGDQAPRSIYVATSINTVGATTPTLDLRGWNTSAYVNTARVVSAAEPFFAITGVVATIPTSSNLPSGFWTIGYVAGGAATLYVNNAGTINKLILGTPGPN